MNLFPKLTRALLLLTFAVASRAYAAPVATMDRNADGDPEFKFEHVPSPLANDAAAKAKFTVVDGRSGFIEGSKIKALNDGELPGNNDSPEENFFFGQGTNGGRLQVDLGSAIEISQVNTFSWHPGSRAPQVYKLYASDGTSPDFNPTPKRPVDPARCGWTLLAVVDTRLKYREAGGQYGVSISDFAGSLGTYRYLLFDISCTDPNDAFSNTFYSEIDVRALHPTEPEVTTQIEPIDTKKFDFTMDTSQAPDLDNWAQNNLKPAVEMWYPIICDSTASEGYTAPAKFTITFKSMPGVAYTEGTDVVVSTEWIRSQNKNPGWNQATGSVIHELVHVAQQYHWSNAPTWLVEGIADYFRWFHYESIQHRPHLSNPSAAKYSDSYQVTAGFIEYVVKNHDHELVVKLNAALRRGTYRASLWKYYTGMSIEDLWQEYVSSLAKPPSTP
ncbi:MAG TPA: basic secretory protein-like protein [Candidatus Methylacidiphilales bacterium]|jgi:hypothetical protein|nr:basic secretory protein-like protein [Candidatus Methylacidiphilales bacterium]